MPLVNAPLTEPPVHPQTPGSTSVQTCVTSGQSPSHVGAAASPHSGMIVVDVVVVVMVVTVVIVVAVVLVVVLVAPPQPARQASCSAWHCAWPPLAVP